MLYRIEKGRMVRLKKHYIYIMFCNDCKYDWVYKGTNTTRCLCSSCRIWKPFKSRMLKRIDISAIVNRAVEEAEDRIMETPKKVL